MCLPCTQLQASGEQLASVEDVTRQLTAGTTGGPHLTAHLVASGLLEELLAACLQQAQRVSNAEAVRAWPACVTILLSVRADLPARFHARAVCLQITAATLLFSSPLLQCQMSNSAWWLLKAMIDGTTAEVERAELQGQQDTVIVRVGGAAARLVLSLKAAMAPAANPVQQLQAQQSILLLARQLADTLQAWWETPDQQRQARLELAQAAALRGCAYLACPNAGAGGALTAGAQEGASRCSGCRVVWYCDTACSHADWAAGHRRVCKHLGAARAAAQAAGQAASGSG